MHGHVGPKVCSTPLSTLHQRSYHDSAECLGGEPRRHRRPTTRSSPTCWHSCRPGLADAGHVLVAVVCSVAWADALPVISAWLPALNQGKVGVQCLQRAVDARSLLQTGGCSSGATSLAAQAQQTNGNRTWGVWVGRAYGLRTPRALS